MAQHEAQGSQGREGAGAAAMPQAYVVLDQHEIARRNAERQLAEQQAREAQGLSARLDETVPGGFYRRADGRAQDAHGRLLDGDAPGASPIRADIPAPPRSMGAVLAEGGPAVTDAVRAGGNEEEWRQDMLEQAEASAETGTDDDSEGGRDQAGNTAAAVASPPHLTPAEARERNAEQAGASDDAEGASARKSARKAARSKKAK